MQQTVKVEPFLASPVKGRTSSTARLHAGTPCTDPSAADTAAAQQKYPPSYPRSNLGTRGVTSYPPVAHFLVMSICFPMLMGSVW